MRLLQVIPALHPGGAERIVLQLATDAVTRGDEVMVAAWNPPSESWVPELEPAGIQYAAMPLPGRRPNRDTLRWVSSLTLLLRRFRPDIVHAHNVQATLAARLAMVAGGVRVPLLTTVHGLAPSDYRPAVRLLRVARARVIACAPSVARSLIGAGFPPADIRVILNGAMLAPAGRDRLEALRKALGVGAGPVVVGIGRLVPQKSWGTLIEASRELPPNVDVIVAGDGVLRHELEAASRRAGGIVRFVGWVKDPAALFGIANCLVSTSLWEGLPLSLLEALSLGVPAVMTAVDGVRDVVPADAALLVPPDDPAAIASAVRRVVSDAELSRRLSDAAREASRPWTVDKMLAAYRQVYDEAIRRR